MKLKAFTVKKCRIEMMPLIDSFFLILVYFMYSFLSMSVHRGIELDLPSASTAVQQEFPDHTAVSIDPDGNFYLNKQQIERSALKPRLETLSAGDPGNFRMYIFGDRLASHGDVMFVLNTARELGIDRVSIETVPDADETK